MLKPSTMVFLNKGDNQCKKCTLRFFAAGSCTAKEEIILYGVNENLTTSSFCQQKYLTFTEPSGNNSNTAQRKKLATPA